MRALERDSALTRYLVVLPYDLPAGDSAGPRSRKSAHTRWTEKKIEWEALAAARGMTVEFIYVGAHELVSELADRRHAGRARYWFNASVLSRDAMNQRLADVVAGAGRRYSPKVHVEVDAVQVLDGLGRTDEVCTHDSGGARFCANCARSQYWTPPKDDKKAFKKPIKRARKTLAEAEIALQAFAGRSRNDWCASPMFSTSSSP